jgi:hypothetical protein
MTATTLTRETMTPALPFDFDFAAASQAASEQRIADLQKTADRELCQRYLGTWADNFGKKTGRDKSISFAQFTAAAARLAH